MRCGHARTCDLIKGGDMWSYNLLVIEVLGGWSIALAVSGLNKEVITVSIPTLLT